MTTATWRRALAKAIAPDAFAHQMTEQQIDMLTTLIPNPDDQAQVLTLAVKLAAYGATDDFVQVMAKVSARGCITNEDVHALERARCCRQLRW